MNKEEKAVLWLSLFEFVGNKKAHLLIEKYGSAYSIYENKEKLKSEFKDDEFQKIIYASEMEYIDQYISNCNNQNIGIITFKSENYPKKLLDIDTTPLVLYYKGDYSILNSPSIAIVGTRRATKYGKDITHQFSYNLSKSGLVIISGLADGIDTIAHSATLEAKGKTIAVLGSGLNEVYPANNIQLAKLIVENGGLLLSEYKPNEKPKSYYFPFRNRIIAGLSNGVLITEATLNSGSMHTKNYALEYGKELFVIPGRITDIYSFGCNSVIKSLQGSMVLSVEDILEVYHLKNEGIISNAMQLTLDEQLILSVLSTNELHYEELLEGTKLDVKVLNTLLMKLEMKKVIKKLPGNFYSK